MKIIIYGTGSVGGYFGGKIAKSGHDVWFIARGEHLKAIKKDGLQIKSIDGDFEIKPAQATDNVEDTGRPDLIVLAVKAGQVPDAALDVKKVLDQETVVLPLQNGVLSPDQLSEVFDQKHILGGLCKIFSKISAPGVIEHMAFPPSITFGELNNEITPRARNIETVLKESGIETLLTDQIQSEMWKKYMFINTTSAVGAVTRVPFGVMRKVEESRGLLKEVMEEMHQVAKAKEVPLPDDIVFKILSFIDSLPEDATASMQRDMMEGRPSELEEQTGAIVRMGQDLKVPVPVNETIYKALKPQELVARQ